MKKLNKIITFMLVFMLFGLNVQAASANLSVSKSSIYVGDSFNVTVKANGVAAWNIHISASGPVSGCKLDQADATADALDTNKTFSVTCKSTGEGRITVTLKGDVTSSNDGKPVKLSSSKTVTVNKKTTTTTTTKKTTTTSKKTTTTKKVNDTTTTTTKKVTTTQKVEKNNDATLKNITVDGYDIKFSSNTYEYTINVKNNVNKLNLNISKNNDKSNYEIIGNDKLVAGENNITIKVTAEDGTIKEYKINVIKEKENIVSNNLTLNNIKIDNYELNFYKDNYEYNLKINNEDKLNISVDIDSNLKYEISGNTKLKNGSQITIKVTDSNEESIYKINIKKDESSTLNIWMIISIICFIIIIVLLILYIKLKNYHKKEDIVVINE